MNNTTMEEGMVTYPRGVEKVEKQTHALQQKISVEEGHGTSEELGDFHRSFTPRQVHVSTSSNMPYFGGHMPDSPPRDDYR